MKKVYLVLAVLGAVVPYYFFIQHFSESGFSILFFIESLFVNGAAGGFSADVLISSMAFWVLLATDNTSIKKWPLVVINLSIGLSCALPLYLYFREQRS